MKYKAYSMPSDFVPFNIWNLWCTTGPPLGEACHVVWSSEMMIPRHSFNPANGASSEDVPAALAVILKGPQNAFIGRTAQRASAAIIVATSPDDRRSRDSRIRHLSMLLKSKYISAEDQEIYGKELVEALKTSVNTAVFQSPRSDSATDSRPPTPRIAAPIDESPARPACGFRTTYLDGIKQSQANLGQKFGLCLITGESGSSGPAFPIFSPIVPSSVAGPNAPPTPDVDLALSAETTDGFLDRLVATRGLHVVPAVNNGACFFEASLFGIKMLLYGSTGYKPKVAVPQWNEFDVASMRTHVLGFMQEFVDTSFPLLTSFGYASFRQIITDEGNAHGIKDHGRRDLGLPPQTFSQASQYFALMSSPSAYANLSVVLATAIAFEVTIHVWMRRLNLPEIYGDSENIHVVYVCKSDRDAHYDGLSANGDLSFLRNPPTGDNTYIFDVDSCQQHGGFGEQVACKLCRGETFGKRTCSYNTRHTSNVTCASHGNRYNWLSYTASQGWTCFMPPQ